jgi:uncharacterized protein (TIGR02594 family)
MIQWPPWMVIALAEEALNVREIYGPEHNQRILMYHDETSLDASTDEIYWCASFANYCIRQCGMGLKGTFSARARSFLRLGTSMSIPPYGCIAVLARGGGDQPGPEVIEAPGHVGFFLGYQNLVDQRQIRLLGGNQSDSVCTSVYPESQVLGYRWPVLPTPPL